LQEFFFPENSLLKVGFVIN